MPPSFMMAQLIGVHVSQMQDEPLTLSISRHLGFHVTFIALFVHFLFCFVTFDMGTLTLT